MTPEEIRVGLGLEPWNEFARRRSEELSAARERFGELDSWRQTGRTTQMLCEVLSLLNEGAPVLIRVASSTQERWVRNRLSDLASKMQISIKTCLFATSESEQEEALRGRPQLAVFYDHFRG